MFQWAMDNEFWGGISKRGFPQPGSDTYWWPPTSSQHSGSGQLAMGNDIDHRAMGIRMELYGTKYLQQWAWGIIVAMVIGQWLISDCNQNLDY